MHFSSKNNFDLIRLFAAFQVVIGHIGYHLNYQNFLYWLNIFPGVPIFFFVSGFLIYGSYEKSKEAQQPILNFASKRLIRIYPALLFCTFISLCLIISSGYLNSIDFKLMDLFIWVLSASTFFQFYNPEFLRGFGVGIINGSLWTISVELQFYAITPFIYHILNRSKYVIIAIFLILIGFNYLNTILSHTTILTKLFGVSFIPWLYMFMLGSLAYKHKNIFNLIKKTPLVLFILLYICIYYFSSKFSFNWGNRIHIIGYVSLILLICKLAITKPLVSDFLLRKNDISYGIYIYHMPVINLLVHNNIYGFRGFSITIISTFMLAIISWFFVEKPTLRLKKKQLRKI